ncbi:At-hook motif nuclear-localized protein [Thalictrum thalictroides]|uniref:AT-hook motif nuclear-localized protein n=1 Tax=Thalictrum thalictroides TaxID=46969 RepID=A0A7J6VJW2_THATH|nr:At-hook motif nuclear-localized protein [Thalictrum thalictroides]
MENNISQQTHQETSLTVPSVSATSSHNHHLPSSSSSSIITPIPIPSNSHHNPPPLFTPINPEQQQQPQSVQVQPISFDSVITSFSLSRPNNISNNNNNDYSNSIYNPTITTNGGSSSSSSIRPYGFNMVNSEPVKRKRGRPRKYSGPDGGVVLALSPLSSVAAATTPHSKNGPNESTYKSRSRVRPIGLGKKQKLDALSSAGRGFKAHVIIVKAGEDVASKIMAFSQQGPDTVCILSANGAVGNVTLRQPATYGGTVSYEGRFEIISLSGSFLLMESGGTRSRTGGMSVSLAGSDGRVLGGGVAGMLIAATPVQVVIASFSAEEHYLKPEQSILPLLAPSPYMMGFRMPLASASPPFPNTYSDSSDETGSPVDWNSRACNDTEQSNPGTFRYSSIGHGNTHSSNPQRPELYTKFLPN